MERTAEFNDDLQGLQGDAIIELIAIDTESGVAGNGTPNWFFFCNWTQTSGQPVKFAGVEYIPLPYTSQGFEIRNEGVPPNPTFTIANIGLEMTGLVNSKQTYSAAK